MPLELKKPERDLLPAYVEALKRGFSPDTQSSRAIKEQLNKIALGADAFLESLDDAQAKGPPIVLPDGTRVPRLPGIVLWMWDGEFCGAINFRWQKGTEELPSTCLGHIGFAVVEWKRNRGYAKQALKLILPRAKREGLRYVDVTTDPHNVASQNVILSGGGELIRRFPKPSAYGGAEGLLYRIFL